MAANPSAHLRGIGVAAAVLAIAIGAISIGAQSNAKYATWKDLETWSRDLPDSKETEFGLGLQPQPPGSVLIAFTARLPMRRATNPPAEIQVLGAVGAMATPNLLRTPTLVFSLDEGTKQAVTIDLASRSTVDDPAPGAPINNIVGRLTPAELTRLTQSKTVTLTVLGFPNELRPDQIKALQTYARKILVTR